MRTMKPGRTMTISRSCLKNEAATPIFPRNRNRGDAMNMNRLINMGLRMLMSKGIDVAARKGKNPAELSPQERASAKATRQNAHKARRGLGLARRFMR